MADQIIGIIAGVVSNVSVFEAGCVVDNCLAAPFFRDLSGFCNQRLAQ